jgi:TolA-binding protein
MMVKNLIVSLFAFFLLQVGWAQESAYHSSKTDDFRKGVELFDKQKYASARQVFEDFIEQSSDLENANYTDAHYFRALCAVELFNKDAEFLISHFLVQFPESPRIKTLYFVMGKFQYRKKSYSKTIKWFKKVDTYNLDNEQLDEYNFKMAYSHLMRNKTETASEYFLKVKNKETKYAVPAKYFYAHIAFTDKKYETSYKDFKLLEEDDLFGPIVPYYIIQILYYQNKNDEIIEYAPMLLDSGSTRRIPEISRILGEAYYKTERFSEAVPYLLTYKEKGESFERADVYQLAYAYYRGKLYEASAEQFETISKRKDSLSQNAYYHLADCYLQLNQKDKAMLAFQEASTMNIIPDVQEDAMYNYAKLSYELSNSPFNDAIKALKDYLKAYPKSSHHDEAYSYLSKVFLSTKNYQSAIETIEEIGNKTPEVTESYQRVTHFRALEFFGDGNYAKAIELFDKSIDNSKYNLQIRAMSKYWRAEALYKTGQYAKSFEDFEDFVLTSGAFGSEEFKDAHYNMGYALFKLQDYTKAITWFRKYTDFTQSNKLTKVADAYNRIGDCYFISSKYNFAIDYYDKSIEVKRRNVDYALFQKAFSYGLLKKYEEEIAQLQLLTNQFPSSAYLDDALFETANAYKYLSNYASAVEFYNKIINEFENSEYRSKSFLQAGLLDYNNSKEQKALENFKTLIKEYPKSDEAQKALLIMKNIYVEINNVDEYIDFANANGMETEVDKVEADSLTYIAAENLYMAGNCEASAPSFSKYIERYPQGRYLLNAHYFKSDCEFNAKDYENALTSYRYIVEQNTNEYTEEALLKAAFITYRDENYQEASQLYQKLEKNSSNNNSISIAKIGLMRTHFRLEDYKKSISAALAVLTISEGDVDLEREVHYVIGKSFYMQEDFEGAYAEFVLIADQPKTLEGAEANYRMIEIEYKNENYEKAIELIKAFNNSNSPHRLWVAKGLMVWSDIFRIQEDFFMAKATLESIIKYYPSNEDGVIDEASEKLSEIEDLENDEKELKKAAAIEINLNENENDSELFEEDSESLPEELEETEMIEEEPEKLKEKPLDPKEKETIYTENKEKKEVEDVQ